MLDYIKHIESFCDEFSYPKDAAQTLCGAMQKIINNKEAFSIFDEQIMLYKENKSPFEHPKAIEAAKKAAEISGVHSYTAQLLIYICFAKYTRERYKAKNIPDSIYISSMMDLKWKLFECFNMHGIWGTFVAFWFDRFFELTRFALGRLQFETVKFEGEYANGNNIIKSGDTVINIHIPSSGALVKEELIDSFNQAAEFYKDIFSDKSDKRVIFQCNSWLLYQKHNDFLPKKSNILMFMDFFDIYASSDDEKNADAWRIFNTEDISDLDKLPVKTSLQRAYKDHLSAGGTMGMGRGVRFE